MRNIFIFMLISLILIVFSGLGIANTYVEEFRTKYNFRQMENINGQQFEVEFLLLTLDLLRTTNFDFFSSETGRTLRRNVVFNVFVENKSDTELSFDLNNIKLIAGNKEILPVIVDGIEDSFKYSQAGTIKFPLEKISNFDFDKLKLIVETKTGEESIVIYRDNLQYDFNEKFRSDFPSEKIEEQLPLKYLITNKKLGYLDENDNLKEKDNFNRELIDNITLSFASNILHGVVIKAEWYNNKGFYKEEVIKTDKPENVKFSLDKKDFEKHVGDWSIFIYFNNNLVIHETFLVY